MQKKWEFLDRLPLQAMLKRHTTILIMLTFLSESNLFGQEKLRENIVSDSLVRKLKIKQVTEHWFTDSNQTSPANTKIEKYNEKGKRTQSILINYFHNKFIKDYSYNLKKGIVEVTQNYYDWNPKRKTNKGDTILEKTVRKYDINSGRSLKTKPSRLDKFQSRVTIDNHGRITKRIDTLKFGNSVTYYTYDNNGKVVERKHYTTLHSKKHYLYVIDSLHYYENGLMFKEASYYDIKMNEDKWEYGREVIRTYIYDENGLILEKPI